MTTKTLVYKIARFNKEMDGKSLQDLLLHALKLRSTALSRQQPGDTGDQHSLINYHGPHQGMRVGEYFDYTHGHKQPVAQFDAKAVTLTLSSLAPQQKGTDFLHSILYFGILKNSVVLSQSMTLRSAQFEAYINWLLVETGLLGEGDFVSLVDCIPEEKQRMIQRTKGIEIHAPVGFEPTRSGKGLVDTKSISYKPVDVGWDLIKRLLPKEMSLPTELKESDIIPNSALEVTLYLSWSRVRQEDSTDLLDQISNQLRHADTELDYTIHTKSGTITKDEIKLRKAVSVGVDADGLIKKSEMWERIRSWLQALIEEGRVPPGA